MTERDAAWMARILARFTPEMVRALARMGDFTDPSHTRYLARRARGAPRARSSSATSRGCRRSASCASKAGSLCGVDLAAMRGVRDASRFAYEARLDGGAVLPVTPGPSGRVCVALPRAGDGRSMRISVTDGVAKGPLVATVYNLGARGFQLVGVQRPGS